MLAVLTNDDGIDAPGLRALEAAVDVETVTVAPKDASSGCSHRVTTWEQPIHVEQRRPRAYAVDGTPADCVRLALLHIAPESGWVLSGINAGGNLGADVYLSGTVAGAREAAFMGKRAIALSQFSRKSISLEWDRATRWTRQILTRLMSTPSKPRTFWNVNFPALAPGAPEPELVETHLCKQPLPMTYEIDGELYHYRGEYEDRQMDPGSDVELCFGGKITMTQLAI